MAVKKKTEELADDEGFGQKFKDIILWTDWRKTFTIFSLVFLVLVYLHFRSVITVLSEFCLTILTVTIVHRGYIAYMHFFKKIEAENPYPKYLDTNLTISMKQADYLAVLLSKSLTAFLLKLRSLMLMEKLLDSLEVFAILWLLSYYGNYIQFITLLLAAWITLFTLPKLYDWQKPLIDELIENLMLLRAVMGRILIDQLTKIKKTIETKNQAAIPVEQVHKGNQLPETEITKFN